ncbi:plasmid recombination protein [Eubacterium sp. 14-2]|uniref:plasmid recombination protein n=1 Tax=Eubacterium sp. 14-2 TaxID=1235790 RepID=UPI0035282E39
MCKNFFQYAFYIVFLLIWYQSRIINDWKKDMVEITEKLSGSENIVSWSCHMDEENPHLHVLFVPCHETEISR